MKRIGILTYHNADNLGAVLQAYALQTALSQRYEAEAEIIDYCSSLGEDSRKKLAGIKALALRGYYFWKHLGFQRFRSRYLQLSKPCSHQTIGQCTSVYDVLITGSDQVWNYECSGWDDAFFLDFASSGKKNSYAASIGNYQFSQEERNRVKKLLETFSGISVRELSAKKALLEMGIRDVEVSPDPVILLRSEQWLQMIPKRICSQRYVFVYLIQQDVNVLRCAEAYARKHNCKIISNKTSPEFILRGSPLDFLSWIYYAEGIFTNSFHGTAFSLLMNKPLSVDICLANGGTNYRVKEILEAVEGSKCICTESEGALYTVEAAEALETMRQKAFQYLDRIVEEQ